MRKKLLALLMCATMVLGSSAVAFASPSNDDYTNATTVLTGGSKITAEYENAVIKTTAYVAGVGSGNYAFTTKKYTSYNGKTYDVNEGVKVNSDTKALVYVGNPVDLTAYGTCNYVDTTASDADTVPLKDGQIVASDYDNDTVNLSVILGVYAGVYSGKTQAKAIAALAASPTTTLSEIGITTDGVLVNVLDNLGTTHVRWITFSDTTKKITASDNGAVDQGLNMVSGTSNGKSTYYTADGYSFVVDDKSDNSYFKGIKATGADGSTYAYTLSSISSGDSDWNDLYLSVAEALSAGTLSTDARAVRIKLYQYYTLNNKPVLQEVVYPNNTVSVPVANDLLSRTNLKAQTVDAYFVSGTTAIDSEIGTTYRTLGLAGSSLDASAAYKTFALPLNFTTSGEGYVIIFDKSADESQNDGVASETATTTAASETAASSPKTGDVAPIAALAVVMMGACGAMVVASKKRA
jgi:hypothetical protein